MIGTHGKRKANRIQAMAGVVESGKCNIHHKIAQSLRTELTGKDADEYRSCTTSEAAETFRVKWCGRQLNEILHVGKSHTESYEEVQESIGEHVPFEVYVLQEGGGQYTASGLAAATEAISGRIAMIGQWVHVHGLSSRLEFFKVKKQYRQVLSEKWSLFERESKERNKNPSSSAAAPAAGPAAITADGEGGGGQAEALPQTAGKPIDKVAAKAAAKAKAKAAAAAAAAAAKPPTGRKGKKTDDPADDNASPGKKFKAGDAEMPFEELQKLATALKKDYGVVKQNARDLIDEIESNVKYLPLNNEHFKGKLQDRVKGVAANLTQFGKAFCMSEMKDVAKKHSPDRLSLHLKKFLEIKGSVHALEKTYRNLKITLETNYSDEPMSSQE